MNCFFCKGKITAGTTTHVVNLENCIIIIKNVPCEKCTQCGEEYYSAEVAERLEQIVKTVQNSIMSEVAIVDYAQQAA